MHVLLWVIAIIAMLVVGASLLTLLGIVLSLGHYDKEEVKRKYAEKKEDSFTGCEFANWG